MKTNSFRLKIALLSGMISGGLLVGSGALFWQLTYRMDLERVDRELRNLGSPQLDRINGGDHWVRFERALGFVGGRDRQSSFILWVRHEDRVLHTSEHWPASIDPAAFPELTAYEPPFVAAPGKPLPTPPRRTEPISPTNPALPFKEPQFFTRQAGGQNWRIAVMGNPYMTVILGANLSEFAAGMTQLRNTYLAAMPVVLLLVAAGAWLLANRALRPVTLLTQTVEQVTARGLDQRIPNLTQDLEMKRLIMVFNQMMDRLERSFHQATRFSADAAHELKTPLTILQGELEQALQDAAQDSEQQRQCSRLIEEIARLRAIIEKLLLLAQADAGKLAVERQPVNLSALLADAVEDLDVLAPGIEVTKTIPPEIQVRADPLLLSHVIQNLTINAAKYNQENGRIVISLVREAGAAVLRIANTGQTIPAHESEKIFDRFYRLETSRSREHGGVGLGLSLAREIARAHGGELTLEPPHDGLTQFALRLPAA